MRRVRPRAPLQLERAVEQQTASRRPVPEVAQKPLPEELVLRTGERRQVPQRDGWRWQVAPQHALAPGAVEWERCAAVPGLRLARRLRVQQGLEPEQASLPRAQ
jgi:hypothetical protein